MKKFRICTMKKRIASVMLCTFLGIQTMQTPMVWAQTVQVQELPAGYQWVSEGGPFGAKIMDANGNIVEYETVIQQISGGTGGPSTASGPAASLQDTGFSKTEDNEIEKNETEDNTNKEETSVTSESADGKDETAGEGDSEEKSEGENEPEEEKNQRVIDPEKPMVALTFDDGPYAPVGNRIMNVMKQYQSRCTFFVVGERLPLYPEEMKQMAADGFEIANHTQNHKYLDRQSASVIRSQVSQCSDAITALTGVTPTLMRLPGGNQNKTVLENVNLPIILWTIDTKDWSHRNTQKTVDIVKKQVKDGDIVLMHEPYGATADAVDILVPWLIEQGYQLVTVSELIQYKGAQVKPHTIYRSFT